MAENEQQEGMITRSIRARESTFDRFKELSASLSSSQADLFDTLIDFYAMRQNNAKGRETEVANLEAHLKALLEAYSYALSLAQDAELRIANQYADQLKSKDDIILDLQQKKNALEKNLEANIELTSALKNSLQTEENIRIDLFERNTQLDEQLKDKDKIIASLEDKIAVNNTTIAGLVQNAEAQKAALAELQAIKTERDQFEAALTDLQTQLTTAEHDHQHQIAEMQRNCDTALQQAEIQQEKALLEMQSNAYSESKRYLEEINSLKEEIMQLKLAAATSSSSQ